jgi:hypothetical protein
MELYRSRTQPTVGANFQIICLFSELAQLLVQSFKLVFGAASVPMS